MHAGAVERRRQVLAAQLLQLRHQVVGVQHRGVARLRQPVGAERQDVRVRAHEDAEVALEAAQPADRLRAVEVQVEGPVLVPHDLRTRQVRLDPVGHRDRPRPRAAAAVGLREGLVQVVVDDVEPHVARPRAAHHGVQVGAVVVERGARLVDHPGDLLDVAIEDAERVRVREHQRGDVVVELRAQVVEVHAAVVGRPELDHLVARHRHRGGVGAVRGVGREHLPPMLPARLVVRAREQHARQLALRPRRRLQRHVRQPGDLGQRPLELPHQLERALGPRQAPAAGAAARGRAAPPRARAASGCASSCTSRADRSPCRRGSCASTASCSGGRSPARRSPAAAAARSAGSAPAGRRRRAGRRARAPRTPAAPRPTSRRS